MRVELRLLGAVEASVDGRSVDLGPPRQRCVLAALLVDVNQVVSVDKVIDRVWGAQPPRSVRGTIHSYISRLRTALADTVGITQGSGGYLLTVDESAVDMHRFRRLVAAARIADDQQALPLFEQALGLWRGDVVAGLDTPWLTGLRATLERERFAAVLDHADVGLRLGQHAALLPTLSALAGDSPLDERLAGQLMVALYRGGRQADALDHFRRTRQRLADELGADPSPPLRRLHQRILNADPTLTEPVGAVRRSPVPRQLPAAPRLFVGRARELTQLTAALDDQAEGATVVISAIGGAGGIGKTWLALHWAHQHLDRFPDGQLHVNLRGFDPTDEPTPSSVVVRGFLDALGVDPAAIPADIDAQIGLYRSLLADKRMLIVLDNVRDTDQVSPLLPGTASCTALITSRNKLPGLVATHGMRPVALDILSPAEARTLLTRHLGADRVDAEHAAVDELVRLCAGFPLALGIVAARAATHPDLDLSALVKELREHTGRLDALDTGEANLNVRAVISWSYHALSRPAAELLGLLGLAPGPDISLPAAVSLTATRASRVARVIRELEAAHLVQQPAPGRYRMHDLIALYAAEQGSDREALRRLVDHYVHTAFAADRLLYPHRKPISLGSLAPGCLPEALADQPAAVAWFTAEYSNLLATHQLAVEHGWHTHVWQLAWTLDTFCYRQGHLQDYLTTWRAALSASQQLNDPAAQTLAHRLLGRAHAQLGRHTAAMRHLHEALALAEQAGDLATQARTHHNLAFAWEQQGDDQRALDHALHSLRLVQTVDNPTWEARTLNSVGWFQARLGSYSEARAHCETALSLYRRHNDSQGQAATLDSLGYIAHHTGQHAEALRYYEQAIALFRQADNTYGEADTLDRIAQTHTALGHPDQARTLWQHTLTLYQAQHRTPDAARIRRHLATLP